MSVPKVAAVIGVGRGGCAPRPGGKASQDYLSHPVTIRARRALGEAFAAA